MSPEGYKRWWCWSHCRQKRKKKKHSSEEIVRVGAGQARAQAFGWRAQQQGRSVALPCKLADQSKTDSTDASQQP